MATKTKITSTATFNARTKVRRPGVHAKTKHSNHKASRNYKKSYRGQGK
jgi:hypothetical protein